MQRSFAEFEGFRKQRKVTRREVFLAEMERVVPWRRLEALIEPVYPKPGNGRRPYPLGTMLLLRKREPMNTDGVGLAKARVHRFRVPICRLRNDG